jgi:two-component system response regulator PilR (NtrC family)
MVAEGEFREDLFYRVSVFPVETPPLRDRAKDIPFLARHFLDRLNDSSDNRIEGISDEALRKLEGYSWPGNVRELENAMERAFILETSNQIQARNLLATSSVPRARMTSAVIPPEGLDLESYVKGLQKEYFEEALRRTNGIQVKAAELLGLPYRSFRHYMQKFNIKSNGKD